MNLVCDLDLDEELDALLADEWSVLLSGFDTPKRITPPPCTHILRWTATHEVVAFEVHVLRNGSPVKTLNFGKIRMFNGDVVSVELQLRV